MDFQWSMESTSLATLRDGTLLGGHQQIGFGVIAFRAQHILANEAVQQILELGGVVRSVDNETLVLLKKTQLFKCNCNGFIFK